jgi:hypothetical protein
MNVREISCEDVDCIRLIEDRVHWRAFIEAVMGASILQREILDYPTNFLLFKEHCTMA